MKKYSFKDKMFGESVQIDIFEIDKQLAEIVASDAYKEGLRLQKIFNLYDKESELSMLNTTRKKTCSAELIQVTQKALDFCSMTNGLYDISLGRTFLNRKSGHPEIKPGCTFKDIKIMDKVIVLDHEDIIVDLGSIAKGYIVDRIAKYLIGNGVETAVVNGRGDIRLIGNYKHTIDIQHPTSNKEIIFSFDLDKGAVATSGNYRQINKYGKEHIINNRYSSVTVIARTAEIADAFATAISVMSIIDIEKNLNNSNEIQTILIDKNLSIKKYNI